MFCLDSQPVDIAAGRPTLSSSTLQLNSSMNCSSFNLSIDVNSDLAGQLNTCGCTVTDVIAGLKSWWAVDLGQVMLIRFITVTNYFDQGICACIGQNM